MSTLKYIPPEVAEEIISKSDLLSYIQETHGPLKKSGKDFKGACPACGHKSFSVSPTKDLAKCFDCTRGGHGAIGYVQKFFDKSYLEALHILAEHYNIVIPDTQAPVDPAPPPPKPTKKKPKVSTGEVDFRTQQLIDSGIPEAAQKYIVREDDGEKKRDRFTLGSLDEKTGLPIVGHDMLMHYLSLDGDVITYVPDKGRKTEKPYIRIRYQHPEIHPDKNGKPIRYYSPYGSANHLWVPEYIRSAFKAKDTLDTLVFIEGEKKAESLCAHGIPAVGIAGIHNWATSNEMPYEIERLIITCKTSRVVMWYDSDLFELGSDLNKNAIYRPATFASSAIKFRGYFDMYARQDINIQTYLCYGLDKNHKGADDLIMALKEEVLRVPQQPEGDESGKSSPSLAADFNAALNKASLKGSHVKLERITSWSDPKIRQLWKVDSPSAFMEEHKAALKGIGEFKIYGIRWIWEGNQFRCTQELYPEEQFWYKVKTKYGDIVKFDHYRITVFLEKRGFGRYRRGEGQYIFVHTDNNVVREVLPDDVQEYVLKFAKALELDIEVLRMLMQGGTQLVGADKLKNLPFVTPPFIQPSRHSEIMCFRDKYWLITDKEITEHPYQDLAGRIWKSVQIDASPTYIPNYLDITVDEASNRVEVDLKPEERDWDRYIYHVSDIYHRDSRDTKTGWPESLDQFTEQDHRRWKMLHASMADKILATGYVASKYFDPGVLKAIMPVDAKESKVGKSEGRTGKSIWGLEFKYLFKLKIINGKKKNLTEDAFLYDKVDETTHGILVDDTRRDFDFEHFISDITTGVEANWKGGARVWAGFKRFIIPSNHVSKDDDGSFTDRQYVIAFSDYFSPKRKPISVFGHNLFTDWDDTQWNYYYNFVAHSIQQLLRLGLRTFAPDGDILRRKYRAIMTETWLEFFEQYFYPGSQYLNIRHDIKDALDAFVKQVPSQRMFAIKSVFKTKVDAFCKYNGWNYNIVAGADGRIRNGSKNQEFFLISDDKFDRMAYEYDIKLKQDIEAPLPF